MVDDVNTNIEESHPAYVPSAVYRDQARRRLVSAIALGSLSLLGASDLSSTNGTEIHSDSTNDSIQIDANKLKSGHHLRSSYVERSNPLAAKLIEKLVHVFTNTDDDEFADSSVPTFESFYRTFNLISDVAVDVPNLPDGLVTTTDRGGFRVQWTKNSRDVRIVIGPHQRDISYLYFEEHNGGFDVEYLLGGDRDTSILSEKLSSFLLS